jgi:hypothetical protein
MISKEQFASAIEAIRLQQYEDKKNSQLLQEAFSINEFPIFQNDKLVNTIIDLLSFWFDKEELQHYCFDCDFGKTGPESEWETPEELYNKLLKNKK